MDPINERRLRPIYDFIDTGNYKKALSEADRVLKKQKNFSCAKVLKSLALLRLNRTSDAESVLDEVRLTNPTEDATLQAMTTFYRDTHQPHMIVDMYEKAIAKDPTNEELYSHLFMSYVRVGDYVKQQKTAQNLYKLKPINPYFFWSVASSYLQAVDSCNSVETKQLLLKLSEKKVEKFISEGKIEQEAEVELYLMILEAQEKYQDMIGVMEGPLGKFIRNVPFLTYRKAQLHQKLRQNEAAFHLIQSILDSNPDQLSYYVDLIDLAIELDSERTEVRHLLHVLDLVNNQIARNAKSKVRAPYLAKIELRYRVELHNGFKFDTQPFISSISPVCKLIDQLYTEFGHKIPFYLDLGYLLSKYQSFAEQCALWFKELESPLKSYDAVITSEDEMKRHFSLLLLDHHFNTGNRTRESVGKLMKLYSSNLQYGQDLPPSDINPSDFYALIALSCVIEHLNENREDTVALVALCMKLRDKSLPNHTIKFLLVFLLNSIGASAPALQLFNSLETKYIQMDSLDYVISRSLLSLAQIKLSQEHHSMCTRFYSRTCRDTNDYTFSCYKFGSFGKIAEINQVRSRITFSLQHLVTRVEWLIASLMLDTSSEQSTVKIYSDIKETLSSLPSLKELVDNRDLRTFGVLPLHLQSELDRWKEYSFLLDTHWYTVRSKILESISTLHQFNEDKIPDKLLQFKVIIDELIELKTKCSQVIAQNSSHNFRVQPYTPRIVTFIEGNHYDLLINFLSQLHAQLKKQMTSEGDSDEKTNGVHVSMFHETNVLLGKSYDAFVKKGTQINVTTVASILEELVNFTETITFITCYLSMVHSAKKSANARRKKKSTGDSIVMSPFSGFICSLKDTLNKSISHLTSLSMQENCPVNRLTPFIGDYIQLNEADVWHDIKQSWSESIDQINKVIENKCVMLSSL